jgi:hypothetical protein
MVKRLSHRVGLARLYPVKSPRKGCTDFATLAPDGRIKTVAGFMDASPAM